MDWKKVWERKGQTKTKDLRLLDGFENTTINPKHVADEIIKALKIKEYDKVLEVGCGAGMLAQYIAPKCKYVGIDFSKTSIAKHKELLGNEVYVAEANDLPFEDKKFDKAFSYSVFHYFPSYKYVGLTLEEIRRVTKGIIMIGDLPMISHDSNHLLFNINDFEGGHFSKGYYNKNRFNVVIKWNEEYY